MSYWTDALRGAIENQTAVAIPTEGWIAPNERVFVPHIPGGTYWHMCPVPLCVIRDDGDTETRIYPDGRIEHMVSERAMMRDLFANFSSPKCGGRSA